MNTTTLSPQLKSVYLLCNPQKEEERFKRLLRSLIIAGIPKELIQVSAPTWGDTLTNELIFKVYDPFLKRGSLPAFCFKAARLTKGEISLILNFFSAIQMASNTLGENECIAIFESDVYLRRDFIPRMNTIIQDLSGQDWDYVSLSEGVGTRPEGCEEGYYHPTKLYKPPHAWVFRCTDSMLFSKRFIDKLVKTIIPFKECLDWELNFQMMLHRGISFWADPPLVEQGSCFSRDDSSLK